jgi:hypothetical protein
MNNEKYNQIIDDAYKRYLIHTAMGVKNGFDRIKGYLDGCLVEFDGSYEHFSNPSFQYGYRPHTQEEFINKIKTDPEFSEKWGLKIEERELSFDERSGLAPADVFSWTQFTVSNLDELKVPTKLITVTYKDERVEIYE